jgi:putative ABC transport system permease protein
MTRSGQERWLRRICGVLLRLYPGDFRTTCGREIEDTYVDRWAASKVRGVQGSFLRTVGLMVWHSMRDGAFERIGSRRRSPGERERGIIMGAILYDIRHSLRSLKKKPAFYATVLLVFALGIGANTVMFSVVDGVLLQPLPYPAPDRLVVPWQTHPHWLESDNPGLRAQWDRLSLAYPVYEDWQEMNPVFEELGIYAPRTVIVTSGDHPERIRGVRATDGVFRALGVEPLLGRTFLDEEDRMGGPRLVVLSHGLWLDRFGADPSILGKTMVLDEEAHTIVGVMPRGFSFPAQTRLWATYPDSDRQRGRNNQFAEAIARLKPGVTIEAAQSDMEVLAEQLNEIHPIPGRNYGVNLVGLHEETVGDVRSALVLLLGAVGIFLAIACANITSLLLLRASERRKELAVRLSIGAGRGRILGQLLTEGLVLSVIGGGLGLLLAFTTLQPFLTLLPTGTPRLDEVALNGEVLLFSLALSVLTGALASVIPGLMASGAKLTSVLKDTGRGATGGRTRNRTQLALLVSEIALTFVLLVGAGLLIRSFSRLTSVDPGFSSEGVVMMRMDMRGDRYSSEEERSQAYHELHARLEALPGVTAVAFASPGPFRGWWSNGTTVDTREGFVDTNTQQEEISADYFETMRIPLLAGRTFTPAEMEDQAPVVIVNQSLAETFWPEAEALGQRVRLGGHGADNDNPWLTVVGVASDVRRRLDGEPYATLFHPLSYRDAAAVIKTSLDPTMAITGAREALKAVDPEVPIISLSTLEDEIDRTVAGPRVRTVLLGAFALFSSFLAVLGIFGLLAYAVSQRTNEIGIRIALGAESGTVMRGVLQRGLSILVLGLALGLLITLVAVRVLDPFLFQVGSTDPNTLLMVALLLSGATVGASIIPARRAMRVDPVEALRAE